MAPNKKTNIFRIQCSWLIATAFFAYQFILRVPLGLIMNDLMKKFNINTSEYGMLSSMYYFGYATIQIPIAILLDKYGPKVIISICAFICAISSIIFVYSDTWNIVLICRFIIGAASTAAFLGTVKIISTSFSSQAYSKMVGITFSIGLIGAIYGGKPMELLIEKFGWKLAMLSTGAVGIVVGLLTILIIPNEGKIKNEEKILYKLVSVIKNPKIIALAIANLLMVGALEGFADVWGIPFFIETFHYSKTEAASLTSTIFFGVIFGGLILAFFSEKLNIYFLTAGCGLGIGIIFMLITFQNKLLSYYILWFLMFIIGIFSCYQVLIFSIGNSLVSNSLKSITIAFLNCINMLGGAFFHTTIGKVLDHFWDGTINNNIKVYTEYSYKYSLVVIPACSIIGGIIMILLNVRKTKI